MNYECIGVPEIVEKLSGEQLYVVEMYRTLSEKSPKVWAACVRLYSFLSKEGGGLYKP